MEIQRKNECMTFDETFSYESNSCDHKVINFVKDIYVKNVVSEDAPQIILCSGRAGVEIEVSKDGRPSGKGYVEVTW